VLAWEKVILILPSADFFSAFGVESLFLSGVKEKYILWNHHGSACFISAADKSLIKFSCWYLPKNKSAIYDEGLPIKNNPAALAGPLLLNKK